MKKTCVALCLLLISACTTNTPPASEDQMYVSLLTEEVKNSDTIVFIEHSYYLDFLDPKSNDQINPDNAPTYTYKKIELTDSQKKNLISSLNSIKEKDINMFSMCIFVPHHRIEFYRQGNMSSSMEICFKCADIEWSLTNYARPIDLMSVLGDAFRNAGFETQKDWASLAKNWQKNANE